MKKAKELLAIFWSKTHPYVVRYQPVAHKYWLKFEGFADRLFALSDHSAIRSPRIFLRVMIFMMTIFFFWALFFKIDQVVHAQGQIIASARTQIVQAADGGILAEMKVNEGDQVQAGQVIAILEKERAIASYTESRGKVTALRMSVSRLQAEISGKELEYGGVLEKNFPELVETQMNLYKQKRRSLNYQLTVLKDNVALAEQELAMNIPLEKNGDISKADILRLKRAVNEARSQYASVENKYLQEASAELNKAQEDLNAQEQVLADREELLGHTDIVAPAAGIVKSIRVTTLGGVVRQGDEILQILPTDSDLIVEAKVKPADIANIKANTPASVKLDAFDYAIYGTMGGKVTYVSADTLSEDTKAGPMTYYRVKVSISEAESKRGKLSDIEVRPGMTVSVDIKTGKRSVLSYLTKPLTKTFTDSFGER